MKLVVQDVGFCNLIHWRIRRSRASEATRTHLRPSDQRVLKGTRTTITHFGATAPESDQNQSYLLAQLKSTMIHRGCPYDQPWRGPYVVKKIELQTFDSQLNSSSERLKTILRNPLVVVEYSQS